MMEIFYVTDTISNRIQKFTRTGDFITSWGTTGDNDGEFRNPTAIASFSGLLFII